MWNRWIFIVGIPGALLAGGASTLLVTAGENHSPWQLAQLTPSPSTQPDKKPPVMPPSTPGEKKPQAAAPLAQGDKKTEAPSPGPGWAVNCKSEAQEKALDCRLSQTVVLKESGQVLTVVTFLFPADPPKPQLNIQLPLGVSLAAGATVKVDENAPQRLSFKACDRNGCYADTPVSPDLLANLRKGKQLTIEFKNLADKTITIPVSLDGFGDAYNKIQNA